MSDGGVRDVHDRTAPIRADVVIHLPKDRYVQVAEVARHQEGYDLAATIRQELVAAGKALGDQMNVLGPLTLRGNVLMCRDAPSSARDLRKDFAILICQVRSAFELRDQRIGHSASSRKPSGGRERV